MKKKTFYIVGRHSIEEAIKNPNRKILKLFLTEDSRKKINQMGKGFNYLKNLKVIFKTKKELDNLCGREEINHQGYAAEVEEIEEISLKDFIINNNNKNMNLLALEEITDPRNIGSIIRTAASFNFDGIIVKERSFPIKSKLMYKSSSGATEHIKIFLVSNINTTLRYLKKNNFWVSAFDLSSKKDFVEHNWNGRNVLLFGSEGFGIRKNTLENSDFKFKIGIDKKIESLNVSNAVSIVCHYINKKIN